MTAEERARKLADDRTVEVFRAISHPSGHTGEAQETICVLCVRDAIYSAAIDARREALEEAARWAESHDIDVSYHGKVARELYEMRSKTARHIAASIRRLATPDAGTETET